MIPKQELVKTEISKIPEEWHKITLGELITFQRGHDLPLTKRKDGHYPIVASNGIIGYHNEFKAKGPGVTIGRSGNLGEPFFVKQDYWPHNTTLYSVEFHSSDPRFVYYFLKTLNLKVFNAGSAVPTLNRNHIHPIEVVVPKNINEQRAIASILCSLDDKIALNRSMNTTLESIGQALFRRWFVDFDFPDGEGKPYRSSGGEMVETELGEVPRGWRVRTIDDATSLIIDHRGLTPTKLDGSWVPKGIPAISAKNIKAGRIVQNDTIKFVDEELFNLWMKEKLALGDILLTSEAPLGELLYLASNTNFCLSQRIFCLRANHELCLPIYLYYWLNTSKAQERLHSRATGTTVTGIRQSELRKVEVLLPPLNIQDKVATPLENCMMKISQNEEEIRTLATIRDALLPKLMSGEIRVGVNDF